MRIYHIKLEVVEMGGDYYLTDIDVTTRFAGNSQYTKLEDFGGPEDLKGSYSESITKELSDTVTETVSTTYTFDFELSKL